MNPLLDLLNEKLPSSHQIDNDDPTATAYLDRLTSLSFDAIVKDEPAALKASQHSIDLSLQSLASRSHRQFITASNQLSTLPAALNKLKASVQIVQETLPELDTSISNFSTKFHKTSTILQERQQQLVLAQNLPKILDILELPTLLQSAISSSNPSLALDVHSHVKRLLKLYPTTSVIMSISKECDGLLQTLKTQLLTTLRQSLKLPVAIKTIGYLKRTMPEINSGEEIWGGVFLVARLAFLDNLFQALDPLKDLAEQERIEHARNAKTGFEQSSRNSSGQTERYLKRWIEVFREQSFAIVTMYRAIFPASTSSSLSSTTSSSPSSSSATLTSALYMPPPTPLTPIIKRTDGSGMGNGTVDNDGSVPEISTPPSPLSTFIPHLLDHLINILRKYLPVVSDKSARESLLTQVLYASGSLGRLGGDFGMILSTGLLSSGLLGSTYSGISDGDNDNSKDENFADDEDDEIEWVETMHKHKILAGRLEDLAAGRTSRLGSVVGPLGG